MKFLHAGLATLLSTLRQRSINLGRMQSRNITSPNGGGGSFSFLVMLVAFGQIGYARPLIHMMALGIGEQMDQIVIADTAKQNLRDELKTRIESKILAVCIASLTVVIIAIECARRLCLHFRALELRSGRQSSYTRQRDRESRSMQERYNSQWVEDRSSDGVSSIVQRPGLDQNPSGQRPFSIFGEDSIETLSSDAYLLSTSFRSSLDNANIHASDDTGSAISDHNIERDLRMVGARFDRDASVLDGPLWIGASFEGDEDDDDENLGESASVPPGMRTSLSQVMLPFGAVDAKDIGDIIHHIETSRGQGHATDIMVTFGWRLNAFDDRAGAFMIDPRRREWTFAVPKLERRLALRDSNSRDMPGRASDLLA